MKIIGLRMESTDIKDSLKELLVKSGYNFIELKSLKEVDEKNIDLAVIESELMYEITEAREAGIVDKLPIIPIFTQDMLSNNILETFEKGVVDIVYINNKVSPILESINKFLSDDHYLDVDIHEDSGWTIITVNKELNTKTSYDLRVLVDRLLKTGRINFIFELSALNHMESICLGNILYSKRHILNDGGSMKYIIRSMKIKRLITRIIVDKKFEIYNDLSDILAIKSEEKESIKVAIIDDTKLMRMLISEILIREGFETITYESALDALKDEELNNVDIVIVDYEMPDMNGLEFIKKFEPKVKAVPTIMLTTRTDLDVAMTAIRAGASDFLNKPVKEEKLIATIKRIDRENKLLQENKKLFKELQIREKELAKKNKQITSLYAALEEELKMASDIQKNILPQSLPNINGFNFAVKYKPSQKLGGDFYDFVKLREGVHGIAFADVSGHGIPASLLSTMFKVQFVIYSNEIEDPAMLLRSLNEIIVDSFPSGKFISLFYLIINEKNNELTYCKAAQEPVIIIKKSGEILEVRDDEQVLGLFSERDFPGMLNFETKTLPLESGDKLFFYTDGLNESQNKDEEFYGEERIRTVLKDSKDMPAEKLVEAVYNDLKMFLEGLPVLDDLTLMCIEKE